MTLPNQNSAATASKPSLADADKAKAKLFGDKTQGIIAALVILVLVVLGAVGGATKSLPLLCIVVGSAGGLIHDLIQNKAVVLFPGSTEEGVYIGWILGIILGGAAGFIAYAGLASVTSEAKTLAAALSAGIALKGITDGAANQSASNIQTKNTQQPTTTS